MNEKGAAGVVSGSPRCSFDAMCEIGVFPLAPMVTQSNVSIVSQTEIRFGSMPESPQSPGKRPSVNHQRIARIKSSPPSTDHKDLPSSRVAVRTTPSCWLA